MIFDRIVAYLKNVFIYFKNWVFTIFDFLGIFFISFPGFTTKYISNDQTVRIIGLIIFLLSYTIANYLAFQRYYSQTTLRLEESLLIYLSPAMNNLAEIQYFGNEIIKDLNIIVKYIDKNEIEKSEQVERFFKDSDLIVFENPITVNTLGERQKYYFRLPNSISNTTRKISIRVEFTGTLSKRPFQKDWDFNIPKTTFKNPIAFAG